MANIKFYYTHGTHQGDEHGAVNYDRYNREISVSRAPWRPINYSGNMVYYDSSMINVPNHSIIAYSPFCLDVVPHQTVGTVRLRKDFMMSIINSSSSHALSFNGYDDNSNQYNVPLSVSDLNSYLMEFDLIFDIGVNGCNSKGDNYTNLYSFLNDACFLQDRDQIILRAHRVLFTYHNMSNQYLIMMDSSDTSTYYVTTAIMIITKASTGLTFNLNLSKSSSNTGQHVTISYVLSKSEIESNIGNIFSSACRPLETNYPGTSSPYGNDDIENK